MSRSEELFETVNPFWLRREKKDIFPVNGDNEDAVIPVSSTPRKLSVPKEFRLTAIKNGMHNFHGRPGRVA